MGKEFISKFIAGVGSFVGDYLAFIPLSKDIGIADTIIVGADTSCFLVIGSTQIANTTANPITVTLKSGAEVVKKIQVPASDTIVLNTPFALSLDSAFQAIASVVGATVSIDYDKCSYTKTLV